MDGSRGTAARTHTSVITTSTSSSIQTAIWTDSLIDVVNVAVNYSNRSWEVVQTAWIWGMDENLHDRAAQNSGPGRHVLQTRFQFGTSAYIISKRGMEKILNY